MTEFVFALWVTILYYFIEFWTSQLVILLSLFGISRTIDIPPKLALALLINTQCGNHGILISLQKKKSWKQHTMYAIVCLLQLNASISRNFCQKIGESKFPQIPHCASLFSLIYVAPPYSRHMCGVGVAMFMYVFRIGFKKSFRPQTVSNYSY